MNEWPVDRRRSEWRDFPPDAVRIRPKMSADPTTVEAPLTPRQRDVMALASEGLNIAEIAQVLQMTPNTVRTHRDNVLRRLPARNTTHAVAILLRRGEIL